MVALIDSEENAVNRYTYDAFGVILTSTETVEKTSDLCAPAYLPFLYRDGETPTCFLKSRENSYTSLYPGAQAISATEEDSLSSISFALFNPALGGHIVF